MADLTGINIAQYKILRKLEGGNMGDVYKAEDTRLKRLVAIKFLSSQVTLDLKTKERFIREAQSASALDHPNICAVYEFNQTSDGKFYIVMPFYSGESLRKILDRGPLEVSRALKISIQLCDALNIAHTKGIIHRDIKPANIFITDTGDVKLLDFGIAKLAGTSAETSFQNISGTVLYMSPEQILGESVDNRTDLWSLGVVMYEMLSGKQPFSGEYTQTITYSIVNDDPVSLLNLDNDISLEIDSVVRKLLTKPVRNRYQLASDVIEDLNKIIHPDKNALPVQNGRKKISRIKWLSFSAILFLLFVLIYFWQDAKTNISEERIITVLPLEIEQSANQDPSISDGFIENLIFHLSSKSQLIVRPWEFSLNYKNRNSNLDQLRDEVGGDLFITGSFRIDRDSIEIKLRLEEPAQNAIRWTATYSGRSQDIYHIQSEAVHELSMVLLPQSNSSEKIIGNADLSPGKMAYNYYLQARGLYYQYTNQDNENAIRLYKKALELDDNYAQAEAGLADAYAQKVLRYAEDEVWLDSALVHANRALKYNDKLAEAYKARGLIYYTRSWFEKSIEANENALKYNFSHAPAMANLGWAYLQTGNLQKAMKNLQSAYRLYPTNPAIHTGIGLIYLIFGDDSEAKKWLRHAYELQPDYQPSSGILLIMLQMITNTSDSSIYILSREMSDPLILIQNGDVDFKDGNLSEAAIYYLKAMDINPQTWHPFTGINISTSVGTIFKLLGETDYQTLFEISRQQNEAARMQGSEWWGIDYDLAANAMGNGKIKQALQHLESAVAEGFRFSRYLAIDPHFRELKENEKFKSLIQQIDKINKSYQHMLDM
jgi:serine/threonine protein kinase